MLKSINQVILNKLQYEVGILIYKYLNQSEDNIQQSLTSRNLANFYGLNLKQNRCICPFHSGADNQTSFSFNDEKKSFICYACEEHGTYLEFIALKENLPAKNKISEAKIFAANHFANINLGFSSIADFENKLTILINKRYKETGSLNPLDYYDITLLPVKYTSTKQQPPIIKRPLETQTSLEEKKSTKISNDTPLRVEYELPPLDLETEVRKKDAETVLSKGIPSYYAAINTANNSTLIKDFTSKDLNSKDKLYQFLLKKYNIDRDTADKYGLIYFDKVNQHQLSYDDFFMLNDRVLFPFKDHITGNIVGFQARTIELKTKNKPKYLNITDYKAEKTIAEDKEYRSFESFSIGNFLFNLHDIMGKEVKKLFIPEGVADSIYLHTLGYDSVSPGQSNLTDHQIQLIDKYFGKDLNIYLFFDNDDHQIGQNNSIRKAYRLWQFGFRKIFILRTATGIGKDLTDCAVKLDNLLVLKHLLDMWIKESYKFSPASNSDLNLLLSSDLYNENDILSIDPREIGSHLQNLKQLSKLKDTFGFSNSSEFKSIRKSNIKLIEEIMEIVTKPTSLNKTVDTSEPESITKDLSKENITVASQSEIFHNLSDKQVFRLREKFDDTAIEIIDKYLSQKQINCIIGMLRKNKDFDINDFLKSSRYKGEPIENKKGAFTDTRDYEIAEDTSLTKCSTNSKDMPF